jgi:hypothetical protein
VAAKKPLLKRALGLKAAPKRAEYQAAFDALKKILAKYERYLVVVQDRPDSYYLNTSYVNPKNKKPAFFGAVYVKSYVAFHLMPVYAFPELLDEMSPELTRRMQGKSCFNFKAVDRKLFKELEALTKAGFARFKAAGLI